MKCRSEWHSPAKAVRISTSRGPGLLISTSSMTSGLFTSCSTAAFMVGLLAVSSGARLPRRHRLANRIARQPPRPRGPRAAQSTRVAPHRGRASVARQGLAEAAARCRRAASASRRCLQVVGREDGDLGLLLGGAAMGERVRTAGSRRLVEAAQAVERVPSCAPRRDRSTAPPRRQRRRRLPHHERDDRLGRVRGNRWGLLSGRAWPRACDRRRIRRGVAVRRSLQPLEPVHEAGGRGRRRTAAATGSSSAPARCTPRRASLSAFLAAPRARRCAAAPRRRREERQTPAPPRRAMRAAPAERQPAPGRRCVARRASMAPFRCFHAW